MSSTQDLSVLESGEICKKWPVGWKSPIQSLEWVRGAGLASSNLGDRPKCYIIENHSKPFPCLKWAT